MTKLIKTTKVSRQNMSKLILLVFCQLLVSITQSVGQQEQQLIINEQNQLLIPEDAHEFISSNSGLLLASSSSSAAAADNQSAFLLDYSANLDDDEQLIAAASSDQLAAAAAAANQGSRLLWRRQVLMSNDNDQSKVVAGDSNSLDYEPFRPQADYFASHNSPPNNLQMSSSIDQIESFSDSLGSTAAALAGGQQRARSYSFQIADNQAQTLKQQTGSGSSSLVQVSKSGEQLHKIGPQFIKEPPSFIHYLNSTDLVIPCSASGNPQPTISWWHKNSQLEVGSLLDKRYVRYDNSLVISAFKAHEYEPDIHSTAYKCQASNALGTIVSRDVVINAVIDQDYEVSVGDQFVSSENDALFKCQFAPQMRDLYQVIGWLEDGQHIITSSSSSLGQAHSQMPTSGGSASQLMKNANQQQQQQGISMLPDGRLLIQRVQLSDANKSYRCQIKSLLNNRVTVSSLSGRLFVTDTNEQSGTAPRIIDPPKPVSVGKIGDQLLITCLAQGSPRPEVRWFRQQAAANFNNNNNKQQEQDWLEVPLVPWHLANDSTRFVIAPDGGTNTNLLLIRSLQISDNRSRLRCLANNTFGAHQADTEIRLEMWPQSRLVELEPKVEFIQQQQQQTSASFSSSLAASYIDRDQKLFTQFNCTIRASPLPLLAIEWLRNGRPLFSIALAQFGGLSQLDSTSGSGSSAANYYNGSSLFDDPNQELTSVEYHLAENDHLLNGDFNNINNLAVANQDQEQWPPLTIGSNNNNYYDQQQAVGNFIAISTSINKLSADSEPTNALPSSSSSAAAVGVDLDQTQVVATQTSGGNLRRRFSQSLKLINRDLLQYQLKIEQTRRSDRGSYQCRARNKRTTLQATSHLLLKDNPPQFVETFSGQQLNTNANSNSNNNNNNNPQQQLQQQTSLKCVASGSPLPEISWSLSGFPVPESSRFRVGDYVTRDGLIVSFVNITNVQVEDGGLYECTATNDVGQLRHFAWLNVTGPPQIRPMPNVSAIAGHSLTIMCPVGGWPIEQVSWFQNASKLPVNHRQKLFPNGTLLIGELNEATDSGQYSCQAKGSNPNDPIAMNHVHISIKVPPVVEPFSFAKSLHRGQRYNIMCTVVRGDLPVAIRWFKDGRPIESTIIAGSSTGSDSLLSPSSPEQQQQQQQQPNGIAVKHLDPYSSTLTFSSLQSHHRGQYLCEATNEAGRASQSSTLVIHVPPEWRIEPKDMSVTVGKTAVIDCQADAFPAARIEWRLSQDLFREPPTEFKPIISSLYMRVFENGSLIIYNTQRTDAGYYLCQANNGVGPGISRVIKLTVHVAAHFKAKIRTELVRRGHGARLRCEAIGDLPIEIHWLKDKTPLYNSDELLRYTISKTQLQDGLVSELNIIEADRSDSALFTCITQNQYGNDDTNIQLIVQSVPDPPHTINITEYAARSVKISWLPGYAGNSPVSKYILMYAQILPNQPTATATATTTTTTTTTTNALTINSLATTSQYVNVTIGGNESSLQLQGLTPLTEYQFFMLAFNSIGTSRLPNEPITFRTVDEAPAEPPLFVKAQPISSRSIRVRWRAPERRAHYGSITGYYMGYKQHKVVSSGTGSGSASPAGGSSQSTADSAVNNYIYRIVETGSNINSIGSNRQDSGNRSLEQESILTGLKRGQKYLVVVQPFNSRGLGPTSEPIITETWRIDVPDPPSLRMVNRKTHSIHLAWRLTGTGSSADLTSDLGKSLASPMMQQAALVVRKNINDHIKNHHQQFVAHNELPNNQQDSKLRSTTTLSPAFNMDLVDQTSSSSSSSSRQLDELNGVDDEAANDEAQANEPILGFILTRKQISPSNGGNENLNSQQLQQSFDSQPVEMRLPSDHFSQIVDNLTCGTRYQFTLVAINSMGQSAPSDPLIVRTEGSTPVAPDRSSLLSLNSSSVLINLAAWHNGACAMRSFDIMFKPSRSKKWSPVTNYQVQPSDSTSRSTLNKLDNTTATGSGMNSAGSQLAQRSTYNQQIQQQQQQQQIPQVPANSTIVLEDLSSSLNYDLKILATNEAGTTEALYTFNTNNGFLNGLTSRDDQQWIGGEFSETSLSELMTSSGPLLSWLLMLLFVSLVLSTGCIVLAKRKRASSSSSCSLSLSSASRSNQSSSNYYSSAAAAAANHQHNHPLDGQVLDGCLNKANGNLRQTNPRCPTLNNAATLQKMHSQPSELLEESSMLTSGGNDLVQQQQSMLHLTDIYGVNNQQTATNHHLSLMEKSNYAFLAGQRQRSSSPHNTDITSVINGSEAELCLGASALNIGRNQEQQTGDEQQTSGGNIPKQQQQAGYYMAPMLLQQNTKQLASNQQMIGKSSTLPTNCHQQILQQLIEQQQMNTSSQQQLIDSLVAANILQQQQQQQQQCGSIPHPDGYLTLQGGLNGMLGDQNPDPNQVAAFLEQQLQQQVYATVKRGCPRPPRLCDYTIYQCPNNPDSQQQQENQQQLSMLTRCCANLQAPSSSTDQQQQHVCYQQPQQQQQQQRQPIDQQTIPPTCTQNHQTSDYQQLRPVN